MIPFVDLLPFHTQIFEELEATFKKVVLQSNFILGQELVDFEANFAQFHGVKYCAGVSNGFDALVLSLKALGIGDGDEVLVPKLTFKATYNAVSYVGATPVFCEIDEYYGIDPNDVLHKITSKTKAIIPVHLYGQPCDIERIVTIAKDNNLFVIEDNAQSVGATYKGKYTGSFGHISMTSFYPTKNLGALGDGGAVLTNDEILYDRILKLRNYQNIEVDGKTIYGQNARLDEVQAAILSVKLKYLQAYIAEKQQVAQIYEKILSDFDDIQLPKIRPNATHTYHLYVVKSNQIELFKQMLDKLAMHYKVHYDDLFDYNVVSLPMYSMINTNNLEETFQF